MSVLKGSAADGARSLSSVPVPVTMAVRRTPEPPVDPRLGALASQLETLDADFSAFRKQAVVDVDAARKAGLAEAQRDDARRIGKLETGIVEAVSAWRERLADLEKLAAVLTETALGKLFDECDDFGELVARTISKRVRAIDSRTVVRIRVSAYDFPTDDALHALAIRVGLPSHSIIAETDAPTGACQIDLAVGHLDLGIADQWSAIQRCLAAIAIEETT